MNLQFPSLCFGILLHILCLHLLITSNLVSAGKLGDFLAERLRREANDSSSQLNETSTITSGPNWESKARKTEQEDVRTPNSSRSTGSQEEKKALMALDRLLKTYDRRSTPTNDQDVPTKVSCQLFVASLSSINTENMDYVTDTYLRQKWSDPRLSHDDIKSPLDLADPNLVKAIWKPEVYFPNAKEANFQFVTVPNVLIRIHPGGEILYILRLRLKFSCMMELSRYPLDTQVCAMQISSFSKTTKELLLEWDLSTQDRKSVSVAKDLRMPQFEMQKIRTNNCHEENHMGNYSCLVAEFHLHRSIGFHLIQSYLPSILIVSISWVSFWMDVDCVPARVTLGVITLLTVSSQVSGTSVPQTSYVKAIDVWMGVCTAFVFAALVEFTLVNYLWRKAADPATPIEASNFLARESEKMIEMVDYLDKKGEDSLLGEEENSANAAGISCGCAPAEEASGQNRGGASPNGMYRRNSEGNCEDATVLFGSRSPGKPNQKRMMKHRSKAVRIDEICRVVFPIGFTVFNAMYWTYYREEEIEG